MERRWFIAPKTSILLNVEETPTKENRHKRYNRSEKGRARRTRYDASLKGFRNQIRKQQRWRVARIKELEKELSRYEQKDSNRTGKS